MSKKKIFIVGAGISGLTAGAYLLRNHYDVTILEKTAYIGGLVSSFRRKGFLFDAGPRAIGDAGILISMLNDLEISLPLVKGDVSTGIQDRIIHFESADSLKAYLDSLHSIFPQSYSEINTLGKYIKKFTHMAATLNAIANPYFMPFFRHCRYFFTQLIPWLPSFFRVLLQMQLSKQSIESLLFSFSKNHSLNDMVSQHFFKGTPANFALGYFENFQDYKYPLGGTGQLPHALAKKIRNEGGTIQNNTEVVMVDPAKKILRDHEGKEYCYDLLLWSADLKTLYKQIEPSIYNTNLKKEKRKYSLAKPGESVFSIFLAVNKPPELFRKISKGHFIYTPQIRGLENLHRTQLEQLKSGFKDYSKKDVISWLKAFCAYNSYEISIPVLKDSSLAPPQQTGLIVSFLFDGELCQLIDDAGWFSEFREKTMDYMIEALTNSIYPGLKEHLIFRESSTPLTIKKMFKTAHGSITGWTLEEDSPVPDSLTGIGSAVKTSIPGIYKAGQWTYSPSGVPVAILTGRIAAGAMHKAARRLK